MQKFLSRMVIAGALLSAPAAHAFTIEKPVYAGTLTSAGGQPMIMGNVLFGSMPDGRPAVSRARPGVVRYLQSPTYLNGVPDFYFVNELNCASGTVKMIATGSWPSFKALTKEEPAHSVFQEHDKNLSVYRDLCAEIGSELRRRPK